MHKFTIRTKRWNETFYQFGVQWRKIRLDLTHETFVFSLGSRFVVLLSLLQGCNFPVALSAQGCHFPVAFLAQICHLGLQSSAKIFEIGFQIPAEPFQG